MKCAPQFYGRTWMVPAIVPPQSAAGLAGAIWCREAASSEQAATLAALPIYLPTDGDGEIVPGQQPMALAAALALSFGSTADMDPVEYAHFHGCGMRAAMSACQDTPAAAVVDHTAARQYILALDFEGQAWAKEEAREAALNAAYQKRMADEAAAKAAYAAGAPERKQKMLAGCRQALAAEIAKRKPDQSEVARLRANIEKLKN